MLSKLKGPLYRLIRAASQDAAAETVVPQIGESKRLLAEYIDARIEPMHEAIATAGRPSEQEQARVAELQREALSYVAQELRSVHTSLERVAAPNVNGIVDRIAQGDASAITPEIAALLNVSQGHTSPLSNVGLFLNPAVHPEWVPGGVRLAHITERIVELPYVMGALSDLPAGSRILDIGCAESTLSLTLASLGYDVTALDPRGYPFIHPNLTVLRRRLDELVPGDQPPYDAIVSLSAIEHFGLASYDGDIAVKGADREAVERCGELLTPEGRFVITAPYGRVETNALERVYDAERFDALLDGWRVRDRMVLHQVDEVTWIPGEDLDQDGCIMAVAERDNAAA